MESPQTLSWPALCLPSEGPWGRHTAMLLTGHTQGGPSAGVRGLTPCHCVPSIMQVMWGSAISEIRGPLPPPSQILVPTGWEEAVWVSPQAQVEGHVAHRMSGALKGWPRPSGWVEGGMGWGGSSGPPLSGLGPKPPSGSLVRAPAGHG